MRHTCPDGQTARLVRDASAPVGTYATMSCPRCGPTNEGEARAMHAITLPIPNLTGYADADRDLAAEARLGGRIITKSLNSGALDRTPAQLLREVLDADIDDDTKATEIARIWANCIEPSMGLQRYARLQARGWDDKPAWLRESALDWPIYRAAAAARDRLFRMVAGAPEQEA